MCKQESKIVTLYIENSTYSAIVTDECDVLALSWDHLLEIERVQCAAEVSVELGLKSPVATQKERL